LEDVARKRWGDDDWTMKAAAVFVVAMPPKRLAVRRMVLLNILVFSWVVSSLSYLWKG
jgi:hypothetical protein